METENESMSQTTQTTAEDVPKIIGKCANCGAEIRDGDSHIIDHEGRMVCDNCSVEYSQCYECGEYFHNDDFYTECQQGPLCDGCYAEYYTTCADCGRVVRYDDDDCITTADDGRICSRCYDRNYFTCDGCHDVYHCDDMNEHDEQYYCNECYEEVSHCHGVMGYHSFHDYSSRRMPGEKSDICLGVELEADCGDFDANDYKEWMEDNKLIHFEHDGSLSSCGVECITQPCSLRFHQEKMKWSSLCATLRGQGFLSHYDEDKRCGLHIHMTRHMLPITTVVKMDVWLNRWSLWRDIARRDSIYGGSYDNCKTIDTRHAVAKLSKYDTPKAAQKFYNYSEFTRYQPLNTNNKKTVEIRIFRGTLNAETVIGTIEACHALAKFAETVSIAKVYDTGNVEKFVKYIAEHKAVYPHVFPMLKRLAKRNREPVEVMEIINKNA